MTLIVSIIIPVYKVDKYLRQCVDSVLTQSFCNIEVILVDDGSPDECPAICDEYALRDTRVRVIHKSNGGLSDARNEGLRIAKGDYVMFLDSDDYYAHPDFLEEIVKATKGGSVDAVFFQRTVFYDGSDKTSEVGSPYLMGWNVLGVDSLLLELSKNDKLDASACMKATKRSLIQSVGLYFKTGMYSEDIEWFCRYIRHLGSISLINKPDYYYRKHQGSITASLTNKNVEDLFYSIQTHSEAIRDSQMEKGRVQAILSYLSYQYYIILGLANRYMHGSARRHFLNECNSYKWLTSYSISRKTKICSVVVKLFGIKLSSVVFGLYIKNK